MDDTNDTLNKFTVAIDVWCDLGLTGDDVLRVRGNVVRWCGKRKWRSEVWQKEQKLRRKCHSKHPDKLNQNDCRTRSWGPGYIVGFRRIKVPLVRLILYSTTWWVKDRGTYHGWLNWGLDCDTIHHKLVGERSWQMSNDTNISLARHVSKLRFVFC